MAWLAIDAGTSVVKSVIFSDDGSELALARRRIAPSHPHPDWAEQDMYEIWSAVVSTVRQVRTTYPERLTGIVSTAQGDGCWLVDGQGRPTGNAILWNDGRATREVAAWYEQGIIERAFAISGSVTYAGLPNAIMAWLRAHQPHRLQTARWALTCNGWLYAQMTGSFAADLSDASNPFGDLRARTYSEDAFSIFASEANVHRLPPILSDRERVGSLSERAASELDLPAGLPVVMAPYDIISTAYGAGATLQGHACVILGTTICAETICSSLDLTKPPQGTTIALEDGLYLRAMPTLTGCEALHWAAEMLGVAGLAEFETLASFGGHARAPAFFLPYLSPAGERSPFLAPDACGSFHGLTLASDRSSIARSVYEGLTFVIRECLEAAAEGKLSEVFVCGGGARSDLWCQMISDVLGLDVIRAEESENGARGAHLFAMAVTGELASIAEGVRRHVTHATPFHPSTVAHANYRRRFEVFQALRDLAREQWRLTAALR